MVTITVTYETVDVDLEVTTTEVTVEVFAHGEQGKSAYQSYLDTTEDDPVLSEAAWSAPLNNYSTITSLTGYPSTFPPTIGSGPGEAVAGNDSRLHAAVTVSGNGITISGQQISLSIGTGATQVAAGNHTHAAADVGAVSLTGNETISGNKNLTGQTTAPNQTDATEDAVMNRALGDTRYGKKVSRTTANALTATSAVQADIPEMLALELEANTTYRLTIHAIISTATGGSFQFDFTALGGTQFVGGTLQAGSGIQRTGGVVGGGYHTSVYAFQALYATQNLTNGHCYGEYYFRTNATEGTGKMSFAQRSSAVAGTTTVAAGATMILEKLS